MNQQGIVKNSDFKRYSLRLNTDATALKIIKVGSSLQFSKNEKNLKGSGGVVNTAISYSPLVPVKFEDGSWGAAQGDKDLYLEGINPVARLELGKNTADAYRFMGNIFAEISIWDGLKYKFSYSLNILIHGMRILCPLIIMLPLLSQAKRICLLQMREVWNMLQRI